MAKTQDLKKERRAQAKVERERTRRRAVRARRTRTAGLSAAAVILIAAVAFLAVRSGSGGIAWAGTPQQDGTITELTMPTLGGGGTISYEGFRNQPLVINFFASWCPNCIAEMPGFQQVHQQLGDKVNFLCISNSDSEKASIDLVAETGVSYPAGVDAHGDFFSATGAIGMPTTLFVAPGGKVVQSYTGQITPEQLAQLIQQDFGVSS